MLRNLERRPSLRQLIEYLRTLETMEQRQALAIKAQSLYTPLELYLCNDFTTGINHQVVDSLVRFALRGYRCLPGYPIRRAAALLLATGWSLWRLAEEEDEDDEGPFARFIPGKYVLEDPNLVQSVKFRDEELRQVVTAYVHEKVYDGKTEDWIFQSTYDLHFGKYPMLHTVDYPADQTPESEDAIHDNPDLAIWPYAGVQWHTHESLLAPVFTTVLRYEVCMQNIAGENDRHSRRVKQYENVSDIKKDISDQIDQGYEILPHGAKGVYPDTHPEGIQPMFDELKALEDDLRQTVGIIKVKELHNASGISREIEIAPLIAQAEALREAIEKMLAVIDPSAVIHFPSMQEYIPQQLAILLDKMKELWVDQGLTDDEYLERYRLLLNFPLEPQEGTVSVSRTVAQKQLEAATAPKKAVTA